LGTSGADTVAINGAAGVFNFNSAALSFSNVSSIEYFDSSGNDTLETNGGAIPVTLDAADSDDITVDSGNVTINLIQPGAAFTPPTSGALTISKIPTRGHHASAH